MKISLTQDEIQCNYCGAVWEPVNEREEIQCPSCRRNPAKVYQNAPMGDVPIARVKAEERMKNLSGPKIPSVVKDTETRNEAASRQRVIKKAA